MADGYVGFLILSRKGELRGRIVVGDDLSGEERRMEFLNEGERVAGWGTIPDTRGADRLADLVEMIELGEIDDSETVPGAVKSLIEAAFRAGREYERRDPVTITPSPEKDSNEFDLECERCGWDTVFIEGGAVKTGDEAEAAARAHREQCRA